MNTGRTIMSETKKRTITLTDHPPIRITEDDWPVIAHGQYRDWDNQYEFQANRTWSCHVRVRQHQDGRMIVYGIYDYDTALQNKRGFCGKAGIVLESDADPVAAIREVGETLKHKMSEAGLDTVNHHNVSEAVDECIADLPAVDME